jgi:hypothetical protein
MPSGLNAAPVHLDTPARRHDPACPGVLRKLAICLGPESCEFGGFFVRGLMRNPVYYARKDAIETNKKPMVFTSRRERKATSV